jgi:type IV pilus assembly protein PilW
MSALRRVHAFRQRGMTLVELLVAMVIGLGITLAVTSLLIAGENHKRTTTSTNDAETTGAYAFNALDKALRSAGSAFAASAYISGPAVLGCRLNVASILPRTSAFPAPFAAFMGGAPSNLRMTPVLIGKGQAADGVSDVIAVMGGAGTAGGVSRQITGSGSATSLLLDNTVGFSQYDLALVSQNGDTDCLVEEVSAIAAQSLTLANTYPYYTTGTTTTIANLSSSTSSYVTPLGNAAANNVQFMLFGVDANHTLDSYDLLQNYNLVQNAGAADSAQPMIDGVYQMHAIYGIDTNGDGIQDTWASPSDTGYDITTVMTTLATIKSIVSVRVSLLVRGEYYDKSLVSPTSITLFSGLTNAGGTSLAQTVDLTKTADLQHYRYRLFEFTVPLRNMILLAGGP